MTTICRGSAVRWKPSGGTLRDIAKPLVAMNATTNATMNATPAARNRARGVRLRIQVAGSVDIANHAAVLHVDVDALVGVPLQDVMQGDRRIGRTDLVAQGRWEDHRMAALALIARRD